MGYEWDAAKNEANIAAGRPEFAAIEGFEWETAVVIPSPRGGEMRWAAIGLIGSQLHHVVFTDRAREGDWTGYFPGSGDKTRIISLRLASRKERSSYVERTRDTHSDR